MWIHNNSQKLYIGTAGTQSNWLRWEFFLVTFFKRKAWNSTHRRYSGFTASLPHWGLLVDILQQFCQLFTSAQVNLALWPANYQQFTVHPVALNFRHHVTACVLSLCLPRACISLCSLFLGKLWTASQSICNWSHVTMQQWDVGINHTHADVHFACLIICCQNGPKQTFSERWRESFTVTSKKKPSGSPKVPFSVSFPLNLVYWRWCHFVLPEEWLSASALGFPTVLLSLRLPHKVTTTLSKTREPQSTSEP